MAHVIATKGRIDVLVNNAGYGQLGTLECVSMEAAHRQFEVNVFGYTHFIQAVLPHMREQRSGCIVNISSILGKIALPGFGWYAASKHAVEALSESPRRNSRCSRLFNIPRCIAISSTVCIGCALESHKHPVRKSLPEQF